MLWWLTRRLVVRPTQALAEGARRVAGGDLSTTVPVARGDELGDLAATFNDMTRRLREAQSQLVAAEKLASIGRLAAGVAHEINNPLTGVLAHASFLLKRAGPEDEARHDLSVILRETERCRGIVKNLLDFARQSPSHRRAVGLADAVQRAAGIVANQVAARRGQLTIDVPRDAVVLADPNQIEQVVVNLLLNAADALDEDGRTIHVSARAGAPGFVELSVADTGCGIPEEDLPHLFEPFFSTKGAHGTGLGLAVTWGIVNSHGGSISVESAVGRGTTFTVRLPRDAARRKDTA
jgi:two-component system NtrC family sensor kinase